MEIQKVEDISYVHFMQELVMPGWRGRHANWRTTCIRKNKFKINLPG
jgi:hypothetical protein